MGAVKRLAEELGLFENEKTVYLTPKDMRRILNGLSVPVASDFGGLINLKLEVVK